jgi:hypothetical protein
MFMFATSRTLAVLGACGLAATVASAQPFQIIGSGATLQESFLRAPASTNDYLDVDGDGFAAINGSMFPDQLAPVDNSPPFIMNQHWQVGYRISGSVFGFSELRDWGFISATAPNGDAANGTLNAAETDEAIYNRQDLVDGNGNIIAPGSTLNPGGFPFRADENNNFQVVTSGGSIGVDFAVLDVPVSWATRQSGAGFPNAVPGEAGYGNNDRPAVNADGTPIDTNTFDNRLASLDGFNGTVNVNTSSPDSRTIFDTAISLTPIAPITNFGTAIEEADMSDVRHWNLTGRRLNGENIVVVTRDKGSGTRNGFMNGIGVDPSYGVGENIGERITSSAGDILGPNYQPTNKGGSSRMDATVINTRLGVGHTGAERGISRGWLVNGDMEIIAVRSDIKGGTQFARPTLANVIDGGPDGFNITGPAVIATMGDPRNENLLGGDMGNTNPAPRNPNAGVFLNNITRSIGAIINPPAGATTDFTPGEFLFSNFLLVAAADNVPQTNPPAGSGVIPIVANPELNASVQALTLNNSSQVFLNPAFASFNTSSAGLVPTRTNGVTYSDGVAGGGNYVDQGGNAVAYGTSLSMRNKIFFDFDGDGARSLADFDDAVSAFEDRANFQTGTDAIIEVLGDAQGDGNFDLIDLRYAADGLAIENGVLNRAAGFAALDNASTSGNLFGTTLANGTYDAGDSVADVAGNLTTRGHTPVGHDGTVDGLDIDYVFANFGDWSDFNQATNMDLSADMNGDLVVDIADVCRILEILETSYGDVNLDGVVDSADRGIIAAASGTGWANGDINGDGVVDGADLTAFDGADPCVDCVADFNGDGNVNILDVVAFINNWNAQGVGADFNGDGNINILDVVAFITLWNAGCP